MASIITATTTSGLTQSADNSGVLQLASGTGNLVTVPSATGTMALTASPTFTGTATIPTATVTTLNSSSGVLATQNGMTGICKAWVLYNGSAQTITGSFNVSSVTYNAQADYTINFTTAMPSASYAVCATVGDTTVVHGSSGSAVCMPQTYSTGSVRIKTGYGTMTANNWNQNNIAIFSS